jgi:hypothetical protein
MCGRTLLASVVTACLLIAGLGGAGADPASSAPIVPKAGEGARSEGVRNNVIEIKHRSRGPWFYLPIAPSYLAYDYPYYYSRGHYPTHIAPGYVYYGYRLRTAPNAPIGTGYASPMGR